MIKGLLPFIILWLKKFFYLCSNTQKSIESTLAPNYHKLLEKFKRLDQSEKIQASG